MLFINTTSPVTSLATWQKTGMWSDKLGKHNRDCDTDNADFST